MQLLVARENQVCLPALEIEQAALAKLERKRDTGKEEKMEVGERERKKGGERFASLYSDQFSLIWIKVGEGRVKEAEHHVPRFC